MSALIRPNHHGRRLYWTYERIRKEASKYETLYDFRTKSSVAYLTASSKGFLNKITAGLKRKTLKEKFWDKVNKTSSCWIWLGGKTKQGYGAISKSCYGEILAHRYSYKTLKGEISNGLVLDHLCRTPSCVNPDHLEAVTNKENLLRGVGVSAINAKKALCPRGHKYDYTNPNNGHRRCRACDNLKQRALRAKKGKNNGKRNI